MTPTLRGYIVLGVIGAVVFIGGIWAIGAVAFALGIEVGTP